MVKIQFDLTDKANTKLERYMIYKSCESKAEAINLLLENLDLDNAKTEWLDLEV